jgi:hypothetical protein
VGLLRNRPTNDVPHPFASHVSSIEDALTDTQSLDAAADKLVAARTLTILARNRKMSQIGRIAALNARQAELSKKTDQVLDGIEDKVNKYETKLNTAEGRHHAHYDRLIDSMDESIVAIDRLSNGPLPDDGGNSSS